MHRILGFLLAFCLIMIPAYNANAINILTPPDGSSGVNSNDGTKGEISIFFLEDDLVTGLETDITSAEVTVTITPSGGSPLSVSCPDGGDNTCRGILDQIPGKVTFDNINLDDSPDGTEETLRILYGGLFEPNAAVQIEVQNMTAGGEDFELTGADWNFTISANQPRDPFNLALVLDRSGSMNSPTDSGGPTKIEVLRQATGILLDTILPYVRVEDKVGVIFFNQDDIPKQLSTETIVLADINEANVEAFKTDIINPEPAGGSTSIGDGLLSAETALSEISNPTNKILLFTDGKQNTLAKVEEDSNFGDTTSRVLNIRGEDDIVEPFNNDIDICVISVGIGDQARREFNSRISQKRCGELEEFDTFDVSTLAMSEGRSALIEHFLTVLQETVVGDKLEKVKVIQGFFNSGETKTEEFTLSKQDTRLSLVLTWSNPRIKSLDAVLKSPDLPDGTSGVEIDPEPFTRLGDQYSVISFRLPSVINSQLVSPEGEWKLVINPSASTSFESEYSAIVLADNRTIATEYRFGNSDPGTGETIPIEVELTEAGQPIQGATVIAEVTSPNEGVGNILSENPTPQINPDASNSGDQLSPVEQKLAALLKDPELLAQLLQSSRPTVELKDADGDGIYTGEDTNTNEEGIYNFNFLIAGNTPDNDAFSRTERRSLHVSAKPSSSTTTATATVTDIGDNVRQVLIQFTLFDALGNHLGPGFGNFINVFSTQGRLVGNIVDNLDGSYQQILRLFDPAANPNITVDVLGTTVVNKSLRDLEGKWSTWLIVMIIILVLIVLAVLIWAIFYRQGQSQT